MFGKQLWIFMLSVLLAETYGRLYMAEITTVHEEDQEEKDVINTIVNVLTEETDSIESVFELKSQGNDRILLILDVTSNFKWSTLSSKISDIGHRLEVTPLTLCSEFAKSEPINFEISYGPLKKVQSADRLFVYDQVSYDQGLTTDEYFDMLRKHFADDQKLMDEGIETVCYRKDGTMPVNLIYLASLTQGEVHLVDKVIATEWSTNVQEYQKLTSF